MTPRAFTEKHGIVMASARHRLVPSLAAHVAGEPIRGSWWSHPKSHDIFRAMASLDDNEVVFTRLIDGKITIIHRRLWPALAALARADLLDAKRLAKIDEEHTPSGKHVTRETPLDDWMPRIKLPTVEAARRELGELSDAILLEPTRKRSQRRPTRGSRR
jgi:hypothetical protein